MRIPRAATIAASTLVAIAPLGAQAAPAPESTRHSIWVVYGGNHAVSSRAAFVFDTQLRLTQDGDHKRQLLVRPGVSYAVNEHVKLSAGYALMGARDDAGDPLTPRRPEQRAWASAQLAHDVGPVSLGHRYRAEHRWLSGMRVDDTGSPLGETWVSAERMRYSLRATVPVTGGRSREIYLAASDEVFASFGGFARDFAFDQNRAAIAVGMRASRSLRLEMGYMLQSSADEAGRFTERNHTLQIGAYSSAPFRR